MAEGMGVSLWRGQKRCDVRLASKGGENYTRNNYLLMKLLCQRTFDCLVKFQSLKLTAKGQGVSMLETKEVPLQKMCIKLRLHRGVY